MNRSSVWWLLAVFIEMNFLCEAEKGLEGTLGYAHDVGCRRKYDPAGAAPEGGDRGEPREKPLYPCSELLWERGGVAGLLHEMTASLSDALLAAATSSEQDSRCETIS